MEHLFMDSGPRRFELLSEIGRGSFGEVYLAQMVSVGGFRKQVALKVLREDLDAADDAARRLRDEARLLGHLRHPNIVQVDDLVRLAGRWAVVMEHIPGHDLVAALTAMEPSGERFPTVAALEITAAVADALSAAYSGRAADGSPLRVIHRDIKPSNIRLTERGEVKVLDFGIAWASFDERESATGTARFGSLPYMAPERLLSGVDLPEGDIYSLGCVLYEMIAGSRLGRTALTEHEHLSQKMQAQVTVQQARPEARGLDALMGEMLSFHSEERPSAGQVARRCRTLARALRDENLQSFAGRFIPRIHLWVAVEEKPAQGVLSESVDVPTLATGRRAPAWVLPLATGFLGAAFAATLMTLYVTDLTAPLADPSAVVQAAPRLAPAVAPADAPALASADTGPPPPAPAEPAELPEATPVIAPEHAELHGPPERLRAVKISAAAATALSATCGDRTSQGTATVLLKSVPAGHCIISATIDDRPYTADVAVYDVVGLSCALEEGALVCR